MLHRSCPTSFLSYARDVCEASLVSMKPSREKGLDVVQQLGTRPNRAVEEYLLQLEKHRWGSAEAPREDHG